MYGNQMGMMAGSMGMPQQQGNMGMVHGNMGMQQQQQGMMGMVPGMQQGMGMPQNNIYVQQQQMQFQQVRKENPGPGVIRLFSCSTPLSTKFQLHIKTKIRTNKTFSCFKSLRCCIYHANKC